MKNVSGAVLFVQISLLASPALTADQCGMKRIATHGDEQAKVYASNYKVRSLYYAADMAVNTDGSPRSYHPKDPRAKVGLAFNNIANAISSLYDAKGERIRCGDRAENRKGACFEQFITLFEQSRDANYNPVGYPGVKTKDMIPWKYDATMGRAMPCLNTVKPFEGYFISQTSISADPTRDECDQDRYLDSLKFNAIVLPQNVDWTAGGIKTDDGDLVVVRDVSSGRLAYAINGDRGPEKGIGEGSIALTSYLSGVTTTGTETYQQIKKLHRARVQYVTFPADDIRRKTGGKFSQVDIDREGRKLFEAWGGEERLKECALLP